MRKVLLVVLLFSSLFAIAHSLEVNLKLNLYETSTYGAIQMLLRKASLHDNNCPPEQSKTYCSGN